MRIRLVFPVLCLSVLVLSAGNIAAQTTLRLWSGDAPDATGTGAGDIPTLEINKPGPSLANGAAILMVPGGAYGTVVMSEADAAKKYWLPKGFVVAVLKYRIAPYKYPVPMYDVKRAMRILRSKAKELGVVNSRIGILGCSAGGHLASYLATHYDFANPDTADTIEQQHCRPDFSIFVYPVITMDPVFTHAGSRSNLVGNNPSQALVDSLCNEKQVTGDTPPAFLVHGTIDNVVPVRNSQEYYDACVAHDVDAKLYIIQSGCGYHGLSYACENWADRCFDWLNDGGYLETPTKVAFSPTRGATPVRMVDNNGGGSCMLFDLSGNAVSLTGSRQAAVTRRSNGTYIAAKRFGGRYIPVRTSVIIGNR